METKDTKIVCNNEKVLVKNILKDRNVIHNLMGFDMHKIYDVSIEMNKKKTRMKKHPNS